MPTQATKGGVMDRELLDDLYRRSMAFGAPNEYERAHKRITALEAERDRLLYSERLHNEALGTAVQEAELLRAELAECRLAMSCVRDLSEIVRMPNVEHVADAHNAAVKRLRAALAAKE